MKSSPPITPSRVFTASTPGSPPWRFWWRQPSGLFSGDPSASCFLSPSPCASWLWAATCPRSIFSPSCSATSLPCPHGPAFTSACWPATSAKPAESLSPAPTTSRFPMCTTPCSIPALIMAEEDRLHRDLDESTVALHPPQRARHCGGAWIPRESRCRRRRASTGHSAPRGPARPH